MKKLLLLLMAVVVSVSVYPVVELRTSTKANEAIEISAEENYVKVISRIECMEISKEDGRITSGIYDVYKRKNMSGGFYLETGFLQYSPIYKNTTSTYKGVKVSSYKYYAETKYNKIFFSF